MIEHIAGSYKVERIDDIPLLLAILYRMGVPALLDKHYPVHGNWKGGLSFGTVACVWLAYILSEGDHCLSHLQGWVKEHRVMLEGCLSEDVRELDFQDDRLASMLDLFYESEKFSLFEHEMNSTLLRVYRLEAEKVRVDMTTSKTYAGANEGGLFQYGYSKDHRADLAQVKLGLSSLDPLGLPLVTTVVSGNRADNGLYLPLIKETQKSIGRGGKSYIGDSKMDALGVRGYLAASEDYYLCPLSLKQVTEKELSGLIERVLRGEEEVTEVFRERGKKSELIAVGYSYVEELEAIVEDEQVSWREQRVVVRAEGFARQQATVLDNRIGRAKQKLLKFNERKRGKKRLNKAELEAAISLILKEESVEGLIKVDVVTKSCEVVKENRNAATTILEKETTTVSVEVDAPAILRAKERVGWRVYATNHLDWSVEEVVKSYREQYLIERGFARLKGKSLGLQPHYLRSDKRVAGLLNLLVIGLRLLTLIEHEARLSLSLEQDKEAKELKGLYKGQPQKSTSRPTSESLLKAFKGISLVYQDVSGEIRSFITPLNQLQKRILHLLNLSTYLYEGLASDCTQPNLFLSET